MAATARRPHSAGACRSHVTAYRAAQARPPSAPSSRAHALLQAKPPSVPRPVSARPKTTRPYSAGAAGQLHRQRCNAEANEQIIANDPRSRARPRSAGAKPGCIASAQLMEMMGYGRYNVEGLFRDLRPRGVQDEFSSRNYASDLSLPLVLPEELLARSCQAASSKDLVGLTECCRSMSTVMVRIASQLLRDVYALDCSLSATWRMPRLRQLHVLELMVRWAVPLMTIFRQPVVIAGDGRAGAKGICAVGAPSMQASGFGALALAPQGILPDRVSVASVACGRRHMIFLDNHGHAWVQGDARAGGISLEDDEDVARPMLITALEQVPLKKVACGNGHTVAMAENGDVFRWGRVLGEMAGTDPDSEWQLPDADQGLAGEAVDIAAGDAHVAVVSLTGDTYVWGHNHHGQCARDPSDRETGCSCFYAPVRAGSALATVVARRVACGKYHTVVLSADGAVYTFGAGISGQLGRSSNWNTSPPWQPARVDFSAASECSEVFVAQVACGDEHTLCLTDTGRAFAFGSSSHGQLGLGGVKGYRLPVHLKMFGKICEIAAGANWTLLRDRSRKVYQAGRDEYDLEDCRLLRQVPT